MTSKTTAEQAKLPLFLIAALAMAAIATLFIRVSIAILLPDLEASLSISPTQASLLAAATMLGYGLMQLPGGVLVDAMGPYKVLVIFLTINAASTVVLAFTGVFQLAVAARLITGMALTVFPSIFIILAICVPKERFAQMNSLVLASSAIGQILAGSPLAALSKAIGVQNSLLIAAAALLSLAVLLHFLLKPLAGGHQASRKKQEPFSAGRNLREVLSRKEIWPLIVWETCVPGALFIMAVGWWAKYLIGTGGISQLQAGHIITIQALVAMLALPLSATLSEKLKTRKKIMLAATSLGLVTALSHVLLAGRLGMLGLTIQAVLFALGMVGGTACFGPMIRETFPHRQIGTAMGSINFIYPVYTALGIPLFGALYAFRHKAMLALPGITAQAAEVSAYSFACWLLVGNYVVGLLAVFFMKETYGNHPED